MNKYTQHGKGIAGFFSGLLLAAAIIAGILFFLDNGNRKASEKTAKSAEKVETEILTPRDTLPERNEQPVRTEYPVEPEHMPAEEVEAVKETDSAAEEKARERAAKEQAVREAEQERIAAEEAAAAKAEAEEEARQRKAEEKKAAKEKERSERLKAEKAEKAEAEKKAAARAKEKERAERKQAEKREADKKPAEKSAVKTSKPTPEQILNSGSIEKARKAVEKQQTAASSDGKALVQMGSYTDKKSADAQRAKLAILGVQSNVVEGKHEGRAVYRVQSAAVSRAAAEKIQKDLKQHGVSSLIRTVK